MKRGFQNRIRCHLGIDSLEQRSMLSGIPALGSLNSPNELWEAPNPSWQIVLPPPRVFAIDGPLDLSVDQPRDELGISFSESPASQDCPEGLPSPPDWSISLPRIGSAPEPAIHISRIVDQIVERLQQGLESDNQDISPRVDWLINKADHSPVLLLAARSFSANDLGRGARERLGFWTVDHHGLENPMARGDLHNALTKFILVGPQWNSPSELPGTVSMQGHPVARMAGERLSEMAMGQDPLEPGHVFDMRGLLDHLVAARNIPFLSLPFIPSPDQIEAVGVIANGSSPIAANGVAIRPLIELDRFATVPLAPPLSQDIRQLGSFNSLVRTICTSDRGIESLAQIRTSASSPWMALDSEGRERSDVGAETSEVSSPSASPVLAPLVPQMAGLITELPLLGDLLPDDLNFSKTLERLAELDESGPDYVQSICVLVATGLIAAEGFRRWHARNPIPGSRAFLRERSSSLHGFS